MIALLLFVVALVLFIKSIPYQLALFDLAGRLFFAHFGKIAGAYLALAAVYSVAWRLV